MNSELQKVETPRNETPRNETPKPRSAGGVYAPQVDVLETDDEMLLYADLPGVKPEDVSLTCKGDEVVLHAACASRNVGKERLYAEYGVGDFYRAFRIAEQVDRDGIEASLTDGVLTVRVPKAVAVRPKRITVAG
jgi:HSP20 family protein